MAYFPMFVDITNRPVLVVGGGEAALNRVSMLIEFGADIFIVSKEICPELIKLSLANGNVASEARDFEISDLDGRDFVFLAEKDAELNLEIAELCKSKKINVNVETDERAGSFSIPSYIKENNLVAAFSSSGKSKALSHFLKGKELEILTPFLGELNEMLGKWKGPVTELFPTEASRDDAFAQLIDYAVCAEKVPSDEEVEEVLASISMSL